MESESSCVNRLFIRMGFIKKQPSTPAPVIIDRKQTSAASPIPVSVDDVDELGNYPPAFDKSAKMCLYRGSFRESIRSPRESVNIQLGISTLETDLEATTYHPLFVENSKMNLYRNSIRESEKLNNEVCTSQTDYCLTCRDFSAVDTHAGKYPRQYVTSIPNLAFELCNPFVSKVDKARAIFTWLHHNIAYDTKSYFQNNLRHKNPEETLKTGLSVCQGYAELFQKLACHAGLEAIVISGHGKGYGYKANSDVELENHSWNAVKLDSGQWQLVDSCWGAGGIDKNQNFNKKFKATAFTSAPETFRLKHFPSDPKYQFCKGAMSWEEYIAMEETPLLYDEFYVKEFSEVTIQPSCRVIEPGPTKFIITSKCPHTFIPPEYQYVLLLCIDDVRTPFQVDSDGTTWTCEGTVTKSSTVTVGLLETFGDRDGRGVTVDEFLNNKTKGYAWCYICSWDVKK